MTRKSFQMLAILVLVSGVASAQTDNNKGYLTGSFETNTIYYKDDSKTDAKYLKIISVPTIISNWIIIRGNLRQVYNWKPINLYW